jgi:Tol biopolymer transport system component
VKRRLAFSAIRRSLALGSLGAAVLSASGATAAFAGPRCTLDRATGTTIDSKPFLAGAYGSRWNAASNRIAFTQPDASGYYRVFDIRPDGSGRRALTANRPGLPDKHQGAPYWHPSGRYLAFVAQKASWSGPTLFGNPDYEALPGFGRHDDLWLIAPDGPGTWQLTNEPNTKDEGVLIPVFSPDGTKLAWSSRLPGGTYALKVADFVEKPQPHLANVRTYRPGGAAYYETGSIASDGKTLLYTGDQDTHDFWRSQIYRLDLASGKSTRLTAGDDYNEHPIVVATPGGDRVVFMSTKGVQRFPFRLTLGTDWWTMRVDGTGLERLTTMNVKGSPESTGAPQVATTVAVDPAGDRFLGDVQDNLAKQTGNVKVVRFTCP